RHQDALAGGSAPAEDRAVSPAARAPRPSALVTTEWLAENLGLRDLRGGDGSWHMPQLKRDAPAEDAPAHIPRAVFFGIDAIADRKTTLPHMLPSAAEFARSVGRLGIGSRDRVVVYDTRGVASAARVWWTFRAFGHDAVFVLDGGLPRWRAEGRTVEAGTPRPKPRRFTARLRRSLVRDLAAMRRNLDTRKAQVLDARARGRGSAAVTFPAASTSRTTSSIRRMARSCRPPPFGRSSRAPGSIWPGP